MAATKKEPEQQSDFGISKLYMWVKGLETKVNNLLREFDILKNDFIGKNKDMRGQIKTLSDDLLDFRHEQEAMSQKLDMIISELKQTAGSEQVETLRKYVDFWNPMTFVTQADLNRAVETKFKEMQRSNDGRGSAAKALSQEEKHK